MFSYEFCEISKNTFFIAHLQGGCFCCGQLWTDFTDYKDLYYHFQLWTCIFLIFWLVEGQFFKTSQYSQKNACVGVSFSIQLQAFGPAALWKGISNAGALLWILQNFINTYFEEHLPTTASSGLGCGRKAEESFPLLCLFTSLFYLLILQLYYFKLQDISLRSSEAMLYISPGFVKYHGEENLLSTNIKTRNIWWGIDLSFLKLTFQ